ncbi:hypothetical protein OG921_15975 [Aldersonia sp. NBC_00410]|uniref:hypothetical protein n=1 Tax=Aldersonia sp. NBC_00410 TaxID=2975954 RepID=UPI002258CD25|nr:hypothetical protein [Aldersonia sp. NBC_00410]MCX5044666.1 hypothetical protein [Aldersonia sp. NBC_00410]
MKQAVWEKFCARFDIPASCVPLFAMDEDGNVQRKTIGKGQKPILMRSGDCEALILSVTDDLVRDWESDAINHLDGMLYMMGWEEDGRFVPLYIGKAETVGKNSGNLSANIINLHKNKSFFARWGDNYAYHIGDLSACVLPGHEEVKKLPKYRAWAKCLFIDGTTKLHRPVYFWATAWDSSQVGVWEEFGPTSLSFLEYLLIGVAGGISPNLLNREGVSR